MIVKIILGGEGKFGELYKKDKDEYLIAVDGGISAIPFDVNLAIGDFDTFKEDIKNAHSVICLNPIKDESDFDKAMEEAIKLEPEKIEVYNFAGGRLDHYQAILNTLIRYKDYKIYLIDKDNIIFIIKKEEKIKKNDFKYISFFALYDDTSITLDGFKYPLIDKKIERFENLCLSNEIESLGHVSVSNSVLCFLSNDKKK